MARGTLQKDWKRSPLALSLAAAALLQWLGAPLILLHCVDYVVQTTPADLWGRDLAAFDMFSGKAAVHRGFCQEGVQSMTFDYATDGACGDITSTSGWLRAVQQVLKLKEDSLLHGGPPCGSWVWINKSTSGRSQSRPMGYGSKNYIKNANMITTRFVLLCLLATVRCCYVTCEQPGTSSMPGCPYFTFLASAVNPVGWHNIRFWMGAWGSRHWKRTVCFGTSGWMHRLQKNVSKSDKARFKKYAENSKTCMVRRTINKKGAISVSGGAGMKRSQVYPSSYGRAVACYHLEHVKEYAGDLRQKLYEGPGRKTSKLQAPYRWRHAGLASLKEFLRNEIAAGNYKPLLTSGLEP